MLSPAQADAAILANIPALPIESLPLTALAGKILREPIAASRDQPPFNRVTMDGIALASSAWQAGRREFRIAGTQPAGLAPLTLTDPNSCIEVMTGAMLPAGADCVIPIEKLTVEGEQARLNDEVKVTPWLNVHLRGLDCRAGEPLLEPGIRLGPAEVAVIASAGLSRARVTRVPRIMMVSTGDELIEPGDATEAWQIYRSNAYGVITALQRSGYAELGNDHLPDDPEVLRARLQTHLDTHDVLILSGGVSMGKLDYLPQVLTELGVQVVFHKLAQRPGKPLWFGVRGPDKAVFALPGNPVSTLVCLARYVLPGLEAASGACARPLETIALAEDFALNASLTFFLPVAIEIDAEGRPWAWPRPTKGSGDFVSLRGTDGFIQLPPGPQVVKRGTPALLYRWWR
jgi:molybdopterin molybdotransferase